MLGLKLVHSCLADVDEGSKRRLLELIQQITLADLRTFDKQPLLKKAGDTGNQRYATHRLNASDELITLSDLLAFGANHANRGCATWPSLPRCPA
jgi:hypothetical protein